MAVRKPCMEPEVVSWEMATADNVDAVITAIGKHRTQRHKDTESMRWLWGRVIGQDGMLFRSVSLRLCIP